jgi:hypothetical protein
VHLAGALITEIFAFIAVFTDVIDDKQVLWSDIKQSCPWFILWGHFGGEEMWLLLILDVCSSCR